MQSLDLNSGRYLNLHQSTYRRIDPGNWEDLYLSIVAPYTGTNVGSTANTSGSCAAGPHGGSLLEGRVQSLDLFDPTRARGFVEYQIVAPPTPTPEQCEAGETESSGFEQDGTLLTASGNQTDSGTITVDWTVLGDPCVEIPLVDPVVAGPAGAAVAIGGFVLHGRPRSNAVA